MDLAASRDAVISSLEGVVLIETRVLGKLPEGMLRLILGRSSNIGLGLEVIPGVLDSDTTSTVKVVVTANKDTVVLGKDQRIAQLLLLPYFKTPNPVLMPHRKGQFGSSDIVTWTQEVTAERPFLEVRVNGKLNKGLLDTGADKTYIAGKDWPSSWPVIRTAFSLAGLGLASNVAKSSGLIPWSSGTKSGHIQPYVIPSLPFSLWRERYNAGIKCHYYHRPCD